MATKRPGNRAFGLMMAALFSVVATIAWLLSGQILLWAFAISGVLLVTALLVPGLLMPLNRLWMLLGQRIGVVSNHLLLGIFFFLLITPMGGVLRLLRRSSIQKRPDPSAKSYWTPVGRKTTAETYVDQF
jgi:hypothetical protein